VGYGDKVPVTFVGRLFICAWMFIGTYCVGMFTAALTEDFLSTSGAAGRGQGLINIRSISELSRTVKVGTVDAFSTQYVAEAVPGIGVAQFVDSITLLNALASGIIDVAVDDRWRSRWMVEKEPSLKDKVPVQC
jgi:polar amino acid transport system substrate-binding protein